MIVDPRHHPVPVTKKEPVAGSWLVLKRYHATGLLARAGVAQA